MIRALSLLLISLLTLNTAYTQTIFRKDRPNNGLQTKLINTNSTWRTDSAEQFDSFYFNLRPVQTTAFKSHFRISLIGQIIDLYSTDNLEYQGILTNYSIEYIRIKDQKGNYDQSKELQYVFEQIDLEKSMVNKIVKRFIQSGLAKIPTDSLIESWQFNFLHCNSITFQFNINGQYLEKTFHCPWSQEDKIAYKSTILDNYQMLHSIFKLDSLYDTFEGNLPRGKTYSRDGYMMIQKL